MPPTPKHRKPQKYRDSVKTDAELIWGIHVVEELLTNRPQSIVELSFLKQKSAALERLIQLTQNAQIPYRLLEPPMPLPDHAVHQGVMARIKPFETQSLNQLINLTTGKSHSIILALDTIQDPHNFGAMIRSASAAGVTGIIFTKDRSAPLTGTVAKVSAGAITHLPLCPVTNMTDSLNKLKEKGFWIYGADGSAEQTIHQTHFNGHICLVIGGEAKGIRPLVKQTCDFLVSIPMQSTLDSLNASTAAAIILFEAIRQFND